MKTQMTLASKKDKNPTILASKLGVNTPLIIIDGKIGNQKFSVYFHQSRGGKTYYATKWPKDLPLPKIGKPLIVDIISIKHVIEQKLF